MDMLEQSMKASCTFQVRQQQLTLLKQIPQYKIIK